MESSELYEILLKIKTSGYYTDVISCNQITTVLKVKKKLAVIINTDPSWKPGTHWVALFRNSIDSIELFDSFGSVLTSYNDFFKDLYEYSPKENCVTIQSATSTRCGKYCLFYLYNRMNNVSYLSILKSFKCNKRFNERVVEKFYRMHECKLPLGNYKGKCQTCCSLMKNKTVF